MNILKLGKLIDTENGIIIQYPKTQLDRLRLEKLLTQEERDEFNRISDDTKSLKITQNKVVALDVESDIAIQDLTPKFEMTKEFELNLEKLHDDLVTLFKKYTRYTFKESSFKLVEYIDLDGYDLFKHNCATYSSVQICAENEAITDSLHADTDNVWLCIQHPNFAFDKPTVFIDSVNMYSHKQAGFGTALLGIIRDYIISNNYNTTVQISDRSDEHPHKPNTTIWQHILDKYPELKIEEY